MLLIIRLRESRVGMLANLERLEKKEERFFDLEVTMISTIE